MLPPESSQGLRSRVPRVVCPRDLDPLKATPDDLDAYRSELAESQGLSRAINRTLRVRSFFCFLADQGVLQASPFGGCGR